MTRIFNPIDPIAIEEIYNSQIQARVIAECVQDKIYYLQTGERNSGKAVKSYLMEKAFINMVKPLKHHL